MTWYGGRMRSVGELSSVGALGGLVLLLVCVVGSGRQDAGAATRPVAAENSAPGGLLFPVPAVSPSAMVNTSNACWAVTVSVSDSVSPASIIRRRNCTTATSLDNWLQQNRRQD